MPNQVKILKAKERIDKALEDLSEVELSGTVSLGDSMILLRETYDNLSEASQSLAILADKV